MLSILSVKNLGIVANASIEFSKGLNIVTGETGAGKSLLIDALSIIRGARFSNQYLGPFAESSSVTAVFSVPLAHRVFARLAGLEIDVESAEAFDETAQVRGSAKQNSRSGAFASATGEIVIRRVFQSNGRTRNYVNDVPVHLRTLVEVASELVDISSQFANQRLLDEGKHVFYLDSFAGCTELKVQYDQEFAGALELFLQLGNLTRRKFELFREKEVLEREIQTLEDFSPSQEEYVSLRSELQRAEKLAKARLELEALADRLGAPQVGCLEGLLYVEKRLLQLSASYPQEAWQPALEAAQRARLEAEDSSFQIEKLKAQFDFDESELMHFRDRLDRYHSLLSRFGISIESLDEFAASAKSRLEELSDIDLKISNQTSQLEKQLQRCLVIAAQLSEKRGSAVRSLCKAVETELAALGMAKARFSVELEKYDQVQPILFQHEEIFRKSFEGRHDLEPFMKLSRGGAEKVRFLLAPNPGSSAAALKEVASGGELSRLMLSIKKVLFEDDSMSVFVFDEIDTGISGQIASKVGTSLSEFCRTRQAIVVTHLPQVACFGDSHFIVSKVTKKDITSTHISLANLEMRERELAKMISGVKVSVQSLAQAKLLLKEASH